MEELRALVSVINDSARVLEESCYERDLPLPGLNTPYDVQHEEAMSADPNSLKASADIIAAAGQLTALIQSPPLHLTTIALQYHLCSAMRYTMEVNVVEILREHGSKGLPIERIAERAKTNANKLGRALRFLATNHIFKEVAPDVYSNNRLSLVFDSEKELADLDGANPVKKYVGSNCVGALYMFCCDHTFKASAHFTDNVLDPKTRDSFRADEAAFTTAYRTNKPYWAWLEEPGNERDLQLFGLGMEGMSTVFNRDSGLGFDWKSVKEGGLVVDVGGRFGSYAMAVAKKNHHLKFVIQDREPVLKQAREFWNKKFPEALSSGVIALQTTDFFVAQPITNASIFLLRFILHDWSDDDCTRLLRVLRIAAQPDSKLLIVDKIVSHACEEESTLGNVINIEGADAVGIPPKPLLPNGGLSNLFTYEQDFEMMTTLNGQERTLDHLDKLLTSAGWKLSKVFRTPYFVEEMDQAVAVPI